MLEKDIQAQILVTLKQIGIFCWKNHSVGIYDQKRGMYRKAGMTGASDILGIINGRMLAIEVKSRSGKLSEDQRIFLVKVNENQGIGFVARSLKDVFENLSKFFPENALYRKYYQAYLQKEH